ncbi:MULTISPECIES: hypothetical protein [Rhizobium]|uniref:hypothetical protein n=1 Tax=Rhizobium TaxID=379 RepID=UPI00195C4747|nr:MULTISPECIES: hypothetical protein [Rhizobium]MBM7046334.1 hypothetical protein [Rhizobium lusitanum]
MTYDRSIRLSMVIDFRAQITHVGRPGSVDSPEIRAFSPLFTQVRWILLLD